MPQHTFQVRIDASKELVWDALADFGGVSKWAPTLTSSRSLTEANGGVGAERTCEHMKMGRLEERVTGWEDGRRLVYDVTKGLPFPMQSLTNDWSIGTSAGSTIVTLEQTFEVKLGLLGSLLVPVIRKQMGKEMTVTLAGLKHHIETGERVDTGFLEKEARPTLERNTAAVSTA